MGGGAYRRAHQIQAHQHTITAADALPDDLRQAIGAITRASWLAHYWARRQELLTPEKAAVQP